MKYYQVTSQENGLRFDKALTLVEPSFSRTYIASLITDGHCFLNDQVVKASTKVKTGEMISYDIPAIKPLEVKDENIPLDIVYEDDDILIINKPQGMVVHPSCGHNEHTLVNAILYHCPHLSGINGVARPGIVHRIDKDTSGLICVAKNDEAHRFLAEQLKDHTMARTYIALVKGVIKENTGTINMPI
ncbi:MAG: RluA family pseudouridine synthase, partial [Bacilli bacterium]